MKIEKCPVCGSADISTMNYPNLARCNTCTHAFKVDIPGEILPKYYDRTYWEKDKNRQGIYSVEVDGGWQNWVDGRMQLLGKMGVFQYLVPGKSKILEFGCSEGFMLYALKQRGYQVMGNDVCAIADESSKALGINISREPVEEFAKKTEKFDLIMSFHVVEHLRNPKSVMDSLTQMLAPKGILLMHVPIDDAELSNSDHFQFFTDQSCKTIASRNPDRTLI